MRDSLVHRCRARLERDDDGVGFVVERLPRYADRLDRTHACADEIIRNIGRAGVLRDTDRVAVADKRLLLHEQRRNALGARHERPVLLREHGWEPVATCSGRRGILVSGFRRSPGSQRPHLGQFAGALHDERPQLAHAAFDDARRGPGDADRSDRSATRSGPHGGGYGADAGLRFVQRQSIASARRGPQFPHQRFHRSKRIGTVAVGVVEAAILHHVRRGVDGRKRGEPRLAAGGGIQRHATRRLPRLIDEAAAGAELPGVALTRVGAVYWIERTDSRGGSAPFMV